MNIKKLIGDKRFYKRVLAITIPIMIQNGITNFVSLLDNIMVGMLGTEAMSGVSIVNQFIFIFNLLTFGAISAAGIFTAQYYGDNDMRGVRDTFRFKFLINLAIGVIGILVFFFFGEGLIGMFLHGEVGDLAGTMEFGKDYLTVMLIGLLPYVIAQVYASTLRETGNTLVPMIASITAVATNFVFNIVLIFGYLGAPALGVVGAAIATVISRFVEMLILIIYAHKNTERYSYLRGAFRSFRISRDLTAQIIVKGIPLMLNEFFWSIAMTMRNQCYSTRGLDVVAALNISSTVFNVFSVVYMSLGVSVSIIVGNMLGAGDIKGAKDAAGKMIAFSVFTGIFVAALMAASSLFFPKIYNTTDTVRDLASYMMIISGLTMPFCACANASYFTLRSGGRVFITILLDSGYMWGVVMPVCLTFSYLTSINIHLLFVIGQFIDTLKIIFAIFLLLKVNWARRLINTDGENSVPSTATINE